MSSNQYRSASCVSGLIGARPQAVNNVMPIKTILIFVRRRGSFSFFKYSKSDISIDIGARNFAIACSLASLGCQLAHSASIDRLRFTGLARPPEPARKRDKRMTAFWGATALVVLLIVPKPGHTMERDSRVMALRGHITEIAGSQLAGRYCLRRRCLGPKMHSAQALSLVMP